MIWFFVACMIVFGLNVYVMFKYPNSKKRKVILVASALCLWIVGKVFGKYML